MSLKVKHSVKAAGRYVGVSEHTIRAWMRAGRISYYRLGRRGRVLFAEEDLDALLQRSRVEATEK